MLADNRLEVLISYKDKPVEQVIVELLTEELSTEHVEAEENKKKKNREPVDVAVERQHYQQALSFYHEEENGIITGKNRLAKQLIKRMISYRLNVDEVWYDLVIPKTAHIFAKHEKQPYENLEAYIMLCVRRSIYQFKGKLGAFNSKFCSFEEHLHDIAEDTPSTGVIKRTTIRRTHADYGEIAKYIFAYLSDKISPIHYRIYHLHYLEGKSDAEIGQIIKIPIKRLKKMRHTVKNLILKNKYDILTDLGLTEDDFSFDAFHGLE